MSRSASKALLAALSISALAAAAPKPAQIPDHEAERAKIARVIGTMTG